MKHKSFIILIALAIIIGVAFGSYNSYKDKQMLKFLESLYDSTSIQLVSFKDSPIELGKDDIDLFKDKLLLPLNVTANKRNFKILEENSNQKLVFYKGNDELAVFQLIRIEDSQNDYEGFKIGKNNYVARYKKDYYNFDKYKVKASDILNKYIN